MKKLADAFKRFRDAVEAARNDIKMRPMMAAHLKEVFAVAGKSKSGFHKHPSSPNRATVDRWFAGKTTPHPHQVDILEAFLSGLGEDSTAQPSNKALAVCLLDRRYRPVILFLLAEEEGGRPIPEDRLVDLLWMAEKSEGIITSEMIKTFLGR